MEKSLHEQYGEKAPQVLQNIILQQAEKASLPARFKVCKKNSPRIVITDIETERSVEVPLFAYGEVRDVLNTLFAE